MYAYEAYVFIDARDDDHYSQGHIPGAHQFDHYRADRYQEAMLQIIPHVHGDRCLLQWR